MSRRLVGYLSAAALAVGLGAAAAPSAHAVSASAQVIINEVFGGAHNGGAVLKQDFVELYNTTGSNIDLNGWSVQYRKSNGDAWTGRATLTGTIPASGYYLVGLDSGTLSTMELPSPDPSTGSFNIAGSDGNVALVSNATTLTCGSNCANRADLPEIIDYVGFGSANDAAGGTAAPAPSATTSIERINHANTATNAVDFAAVTPTPRNSSMPDQPAGPLGLTAPASASIEVNGTWTGTFTPVCTPGPCGALIFAIDPAVAGASLVSTSAGDVTFTPTATGPAVIRVTVTDGTNTASASVQVQVNPPAGQVADIATIRSGGAGTVTTQGYVTGRYPGRGFVLQDGDSGGAGYSLAANPVSHGIWIANTATTNMPAIGSFVKVTGTYGTVDGKGAITVATSGITTGVTPVGAAPLPLDLPWPATSSARKQIESMLFQPTDSYVVNGNYNTNYYGEVELAYGNSPAQIPTDAVAFSNSAGIQAVKDANYAKTVTLDDGLTTNFNTTKTAPVPYLLADGPGARTTAAVTFTKPVIVDLYNSTWKLQPTEPVSGDTWQTAGPVSFADNRTAAPDGAALSARGVPSVTLASFNVLNYFTTTGAIWTAAGGNCSWYNDRAGTHITVNTCSGTAGTGTVGPRGAADAASLKRQQDKIVKAINGVNASVVGLLEIENSEKVNTTGSTYQAIDTLVAALNADAGSTKWAAIHNVTGRQTDAITAAMIYQPAAVTPWGAAKAMSSSDTGWSAFSNARKPIGQAFTPADGSAPFFVSVNHLKSKGGSGSGNNADTGQGNYNYDRTKQAEALATWVTNQINSYSPKIADAYILGDINAYSFEDPILALENAGYKDANKELGGNAKHSYIFTGSYGQESGSLDHVLANPSGLARLSGVDVWNINSVEALALEYSRYNYNVTNFYAATPYRSSDHDPVVVGLLGATVPPTLSDPTDVSVLVGETATFTVSITAGSPAPSLQWQVSTDGGTTWSPIAGATSATLTITGATLAQNGSKYRAIATNGVNPDAMSGAATLTVRQAPSLTSPTDQSVLVGATATFTVSVTAGSPTPSLQWEAKAPGASAWTAMAGETSTTLTVTGARWEQNGTAYRVVATNAVGSATSSPAVLTVTAPALTITAPAGSSVPAGQSWQGSFTATGGVAPITFALVNPPAGVSINPTTGKVTYAPPAGTKGAQVIVVKATDKAGQNAQARVTVTVTVLPDTDSCAALDTPLFRFYKNDGTHFYTASASEAATVKGYSQYTYEGIVGFIGAANARPCATQTELYRFYKNDGTHFYTASAYEAELVKTFSQYSYEGVVGVVDTAASGTTAGVHRFYKFAAGTHFYTASDYERGQVMAYPEYRYENVAFYLRPPTS